MTLATTDTSMYYDLHPLLSRNAQYNFVVGQRGNGKTFAFKDWAIRDYIKRKAEFIYLRRYDTELVDRQRFFDDIAWKYPEYEFRVEGYRAQIRPVSDEEKNPHEWQTFGYFIKLVNAVTKKSVPYPKVNKIGFDEFILEKGYVHYLPNEVHAFLDFYVTVDRNQDRVRVVFMANSVSIMNPYFLYYNVKIPRGQEFVTMKGGYVCIHYVNSEQYREHVKQTRFAKMVEGTAYARYAIENVFRDDHDKFIQRKPSSAKFYFALTFAEHTVGVWCDAREGVYYICTKYPKNTSMEFVLTKQDMQPNLIMVERSSGFLRSVKQLFMQGSVYFDTPRTREFMNDVFNFLNMR